MVAKETLQTHKTLTKIIKSDIDHHPAVEEYVVREDQNKILGWTALSCLIVIIIVIISTGG